VGFRLTIAFSLRTLASRDAGASGGLRATASPYPPGMSILSSRLSCGVPLIVEHMPSAKSGAIAWMLPVGAAHDPIDRQGLASMLSELIFRGAGSLDSRAQADAMDAVGLSRSSSTGMVYIRLTAICIGRDLGRALELLTDIVRRPRFEAASIEPTRELALQSLAGLRDDPAHFAGTLLTERHNTLPYNRTGLGDEAGLRAISRDDIVHAWARGVRPESSIIAVAGDADGEAIQEQLEEQLSDWQGAHPEPVLSPNPARGSTHHETEDSSQVHIYAAHDAPAENSKDAIFERITLAVLSGGSSSRLFSEVREKRGLCYSVSASYSADKHFGRVVAYVGTTPERAQQSLDVLSEQMALINSGVGKVTQEELDRAVIGFKSSLVFSGESTGARAMSLALDQHRIGHPRSLEEMSAQIDLVTLDQLNEYLTRREPGPVTLVTLGPAELQRPANL